MGNPCIGVLLFPPKRLVSFVFFFRKGDFFCFRFVSVTFRDRGGQPICRRLSVQLLFPNFVFL